MKVPAVEMIYLDDQNEVVEQEDFRIIVRRGIKTDAAWMEFNNHSHLDPSTTDSEDSFVFRCTPSEAKEIGKALLAVAATEGLKS